MPYPRGIHVIEHGPPGGPSASDVVVLVHGSLDRGDSFNRVIRRLPDLTVVTYDRRGYQHSRGAQSPMGLGAHIEDLLAVVDEATSDAGRATAVGHSFGGDVVIGAALAEPSLFASIGAFEPPLPWLGFRRKAPAPGSPSTAGPGSDAPAWTPLAEDPAEEAERFFVRMVGEHAWHRLSESGRSERRADGPALVDDLRALRGPVPFDAASLDVPAVFGRGGLEGDAHHRDAVAWLVDNVAGAEMVEIQGAGHGAHLSHPDAFAAFVRAAVTLGRRDPEDELETAAR